MNFTRRFLVLAAALVLGSAAAPAATVLETSVVAAPMPHKAQFGGGAPTTVHFVRLHADLGPSQMMEKMARNLREGVKSCIETNRRRGVASNPPRSYPDLSSGTNTDTYWARNRSISYARGYLATINADCSLKEEESFNAILSSSRGTCRIDLVAKTAEGLCDAAAHASAPAPAAPARIGGLQAALAKMAADPRSAAAAANIARLAGPGAGATGRTKKILGIECELVNAAGGADMTACIARGGSFQSPAEGGMILENIAPGVQEAVATEAALDAQVGATIFAPHMAGGFRVGGASK
jgi:hypothetical protein